ncbi:ferrous iron transport protein A [Chloroflexota bacterium]
MTDRKLVTLRQMGAGQSGKVAQIQGGQGFINRLGAIGLRPGKRITKVSSMLMQGPVTIQSGSTRMAIGFGMANRIIVELEEIKDDMS